MTDRVAVVTRQVELLEKLNSQLAESLIPEHVDLIRKNAETIVLLLNNQ